MLNHKIFRNILSYLSIFFIVEVLSYLSLINSDFNLIIFIVLVLFCLVLSIYRLEYGLLMVLTELFIGSMGHLFVISFVSVQLPIRMALWSVVLIVFLFKFVQQLIKDKTASEYLIKLKEFSFKKYFILLAVFIFIGLINAYLRGHALGLIFSDFNAWLYWLLLLPAVAVYGNMDERLFKNLKTVFLASAIFLSLKTLFLLFVFTHNLSFSSNIYNWLRKTLVGEMTPSLSGWPRIFIQGQIYCGVALFLTFWQSLRKPKNILNIFLAMLFASSILVSLSRSFWVGLAGAFGFSLILIWRYFSWRKALSSAIWFIISIGLGFALIYLTAIFPYPAPGKFSADFLDRVSNANESAVASRWSLLPVLMKAIIKEPLLGQGYGATITYHSSDPRVLQNNPSGEYTTYAFEWGYFDLWLKIGLLGLLSYLFLILILTKKAVNLGKRNENYLAFGIAASIIFLALTNFFTPYLNHPLGIGILILGSCLIQKDRVY